MRAFVVDPPLFTLPYDVHFARALAAAGATVDLIGRPLRGYERIEDERFRFRPLFYRLTEPGMHFNERIVVKAECACDLEKPK